MSGAAWRKPLGLRSARGGPWSEAPGSRRTPALADVRSSPPSLASVPLSRSRLAVTAALPGDSATANAPGRSPLLAGVVTLGTVIAEPTLN